jgi:hypothetical protein
VGSRKRVRIPLSIESQVCSRTFGAPKKNPGPEASQRPGPCFPLNEAAHGGHAQPLRLRFQNETVWVSTRFSLTVLEMRGRWRRDFPESLER